MLLFSLTARGDGFPVGFENPMGLGDGQKLNPAHVDGKRVCDFLVRMGLGKQNPVGFVPVAMLNPVARSL